MLRQPVAVNVLQSLSRVELISEQGTVVLKFDSHHDMKKWLVDLTAKVMGYEMGAIVTGE